MQTTEIATRPSTPAVDHSMSQCQWAPPSVFQGGHSFANVFYVNKYYIKKARPEPQASDDRTLWSKDDDSPSSIRLGHLISQLDEKHFIEILCWAKDRKCPLGLGSHGSALANAWLVVSTLSPWLTLSVSIKVVSRIPGAQAWRVPISVLNKLRQISDQVQWWCHLKTEICHLPNGIKAPSKDLHQPSERKTADRVQLRLQRFHGDNPKLDRKVFIVPETYTTQKKHGAQIRNPKYTPEAGWLAGISRQKPLILLFWWESNTNDSSTFLLKKIRSCNRLNSICRG